LDIGCHKRLTRSGHSARNAFSKLQPLAALYYFVGQTGAGMQDQRISTRIDDEIAVHVDVEMGRNLGKQLLDHCPVITGGEQVCYGVGENSQPFVALV
jgi:hypothetical protein